jgi:hypothetical protein
LAQIVPGGTTNPNIGYYAAFEETTGLANTDCGNTTAALIASIEEGRVYANVHSEAFPGGIVRGQLALDPDANIQAFDVTMSGDEAVPPVTTDVTGQATFVYEIPVSGDPEGIGFFGVVDNPSAIPITIAHIHCAPAGGVGPPIATLLPLAEDGRAFNIIRFRGGLVAGQITDPECGATIPELIASMEAGDVYVNVHSTNNPSGEIRGQVPALTMPEAPSSSPSFSPSTSSPTTTPSTSPSAAPVPDPTTPGPTPAPTPKPTPSMTPEPTPDSGDAANSVTTRSFATMIASLAILFAM